jgi:hypothetical protein
MTLVAGCQTNLTEFKVQVKKETKLSKKSKLSTQLSKTINSGSLSEVVPLSGIAKGVWG